MAGHNWTQAEKAATLLSRNVCSFDQAGVTLYMFDDKFEVFRNVHDPQKIQQLFHQHRPRGGTKMGPVLRQAFQEADQAHRTSGRGTTILVITDGEPDNKHDVEQAIINASNRLQRDEDLSLSFIQIGNDPAATRFLKHLDDELVRKCKFDIVDTLKSSAMEGMSFAQFIELSIRD